MARPVSIAPINVTLIRVLIDRQDLTIKEFAESIGMKRDYLSHILHGRKKVNDEWLAKIATALDVSPDYFKQSVGSLFITKVDTDLVDVATKGTLTPPKELTEYINIAERMGRIDCSPDIPDTDTIHALDFWKKPSILPFRSDKAAEFWDFEGDEILIRGPARCGKSTLILEYVIAKMLQNAGMQVLIARAFSVDLDAVRQNIVDLMKYRFDDPLSSIKVSGGKKFHTVHINGGEIHLRGIDRPGSQLGAGYDLAVFSQAEQIKKENIDVISSRVTPAGGNWVENSQPRSMTIYDANPNRIDHWIEQAISKGLMKIDFDFPDHPAYFTEDGEETQLYQHVHSRLSRLEGVWRQRLLEGKAANPEGTIFELQDCHILTELPANFATHYSYYRGFDFGMKDPSVCLWFGVHRATGDVIVFREWRRVNVDTIAMGEAVKRFTDEKILMTVIDNDENLQNILRKQCGIATTLAQKGPGSIASGITLAQHRLKLAEQGEDGGLYFYNNPVVRDPAIVRNNEPLTTIDEGELYAWEENSDKPMDKHNHGWDIIRYVLDYLEHRASPVGFGGTGAQRQRVL